MASALDGITILDLTEGPAGALATMLLCDHGARVIRVVDRHATAPRHGGYLVWDRGKECLQLDLSRIEAPSQSSRPPATTVQRTPESPTEVYARLIRSADVLVEDFSPGLQSSEPRPGRLALRTQPAPDPLLDHGLRQAWPAQRRAADR